MGQIEPVEDVLIGDVLDYIEDALSRGLTTKEQIVSAGMRDGWRTK